MGIYPGQIDNRSMEQEPSHFADTNMMIRIISIVIMLALGISSQALANSTDAEIKHIPQYVRKSNVIFIRNGREYQSSEAIKHLVRKRDYFKDQIKTAEDFIRLCATKSLMSGEPYRIITKDGHVEESSKWLMAELKRFRKQKK